jgi:Ca-activated chloride channel family protein
MFTNTKGFWTILALIVLTGLSLAYVGSRSAHAVGASNSQNGHSDGLIRVDARLSQSKVLLGSDGNVSMALKLLAAALPEDKDLADTPVDLVVVLDRSGSMQGQKIDDARRAIVQLMEHLTPKDRLSLVTYSNRVDALSGLMPMDHAHRIHLANAVGHVHAGGGTNLGGGLQKGIETLMQIRGDGRQRKVILISDGLANQGITDPNELGRMASAAVEHNFSISSVGVGHDFNEMLMTRLADHGAGRYYFLENPKAFARVFKEEYRAARKVAAAGLEVKVPMPDGVRLTHAGGYPVTNTNGWAVFYPGDLLSGQERNLFLTFKVPANREGEVEIEHLVVRYHHQGHSRTLRADLGMKVACVKDTREVTASVDRDTWSRQVLQEDFSRLKTSVADAIRKGKRELAEEKIREYEVRTRQLNDVVNSEEVDRNLGQDVGRLRQSVKETFAGAPQAVEAKRKQHAKTLQYDSYQIRRDQKSKGGK